MPKCCNLLDSFTYAFIQQTLPEYLLARHCSAVNKEDKAPAIENLHSGGVDKTLNKMNQRIYVVFTVVMTPGILSKREKEAGPLGGGDLRREATQNLGQGPSRRAAMALAAVRGGERGTRETGEASVIIQGERRMAWPSWKRGRSGLAWKVEPTLARRSGRRAREKSRTVLGSGPSTQRKEVAGECLMGGVATLGRTRNSVLNDREGAGSWMHECEVQGGS